MKESKINNLWFFLLFIIYMETILKVFLFINSFDLNFIYLILLTLPIALICYLLTNIFNKLINKILSYVLIVGVTIIFMAQLIYYKTYLSIFSVYSMGEAGQLLDYTNTILKIMIRNSFALFFFLIPLVVYLFFNKYYINYKRVSLKHGLIMLVITLILQPLVALSLLISGNNMYSVKQLYYDVHSPTLSVSKLGLITTMRLDLKRLIFGFEEKNNSISVNKNNDKKPDEKKEYNVMKISFDDLIKDEKNKTIIDMHNYFKNVEPTIKNKYTGMFKGNNLIMLLGESFNSIAIDKNLTPTLYKLYMEGFYFTNFYNPVFPVSTTDGEYITATSLIPREGGWSAYRSSNNYNPFTLGNILKPLGYKTTAYHDHTASYYHRDAYVPTWGYEYYACRRGLNINCHIWPESDLEMIDATYNQYINNAPFVTYYVTVSGHCNYTRIGNMMTDKNWSYVKDLPYSEGPKAYLAANIELDKALASLIKHLDDAGILKDTVIAMGGDHYPYELSLEEINEIANPKRDAVFEQSHSAFILWNSEMKPVTIDKYGSSLDILPTILNLFDVEYDSRLLMGRDLLSDSDPLVIFSNRSFITDKGRYNSLSKEFYTNDGKKVTDNKEYIDKINKVIYDRFYYSRLILDDDYYRKLFKK